MDFELFYHSTSVKLPLSLQIAIVDEAIRKIESVIGRIGILINLKKRV